MTPSELAAAGAVIYGARWQASLAVALGVHPRTMRRWLAGTVLIPQSLAGEIGALESIARGRVEREQARRIRGATDDTG